MQLPTLDSHVSACTHARFQACFHIYKYQSRTKDHDLCGTKKGSLQFWASFDVNVTVRVSQLGEDKPAKTSFMHLISLLEEVISGIKNINGVPAKSIILVIWHTWIKMNKESKNHITTQGFVIWHFRRQKMELNDGNLLTLSDYLLKTLSPDASVRKPGLSNFCAKIMLFIPQIQHYEVKFHKLTSFLLSSS